MEWVSLSYQNFSYQQILDIMLLKVQEVINLTSNETIYLVEHDDVYTVGRNFVNTDLLKLKPDSLVHINRGGKITYHGIGQRVIYPILNLNLNNRARDIKLYIKMLEEWIINTLEIFGIKAITIEDKVGIWVSHLSTYFKIASIGISIRKWVTYHGIAVNVFTDLKKFQNIIPCGISNHSMTSMKELGVSVDFNTFDEVLKNEFHKIFS